MTWRAALGFLGRRRPARRDPDFLIIGAQRCGTTSLFHYLAAHPQVTVPQTKEIHFFDLQYDRGLDWYRECLATTGGRPPARAALAGEATPYYIFHPHAVRRIGRDFPAVKLVALLRDPVERAYSHYWHMVRLGHEPLSFEEAVAREPERLAGELDRATADEWYRSDALVRHSYLLRGLYADQLERVFRVFARSQVKVLRSEDLYADPQKVFDEVVAFLGLGGCTLTGPENMTAVTEGTGDWRPPPMPGELRRRLADYFRPHNERLCALLGRELAWTGASSP